MSRRQTFWRVLVPTDVGLCACGACPNLLDGLDQRPRPCVPSPGVQDIVYWARGVADQGTPHVTDYPNGDWRCGTSSRSSFSTLAFTRVSEIVFARLYPTAEPGPGTRPRASASAGRPPHEASSYFFGPDLIPESVRAAIGGQAPPASRPGVPPP